MNAYFICEEAKKRWTLSQSGISEIRIFAQYNKKPGKMRQFKIRIVEDKLSHSHTHVAHSLSNAIDNGNSECQRWGSCANAAARPLHSHMYAPHAASLAAAKLPFAWHCTWTHARLFALQFDGLSTFTSILTLAHSNIHTSFYVCMYSAIYIPICTCVCLYAHIWICTLNMSFYCNFRNSKFEYWYSSRSKGRVYQ